MRDYSLRFSKKMKSSMNLVPFILAYNAVFAPIMFARHLYFLSLLSVVLSLGAAANYAVVKSNLGFMPVYDPKRKIQKLPEGYRFAYQDTKLAWLCDRFWLAGRIASVGDFLIVGSQAAFVVWVILEGWKKWRGR